MLVLPLPIQDQGALTTQTEPKTRALVMVNFTERAEVEVAMIQVALLIFLL